MHCLGLGRQALSQPAVEVVAGQPLRLDHHGALVEQGAQPVVDGELDVRSGCRQGIAEYPGPSDSALLKLAQADLVVSRLVGDAGPLTGVDQDGAAVAKVDLQRLQGSYRSLGDRRRRAPSS